MTSIFLVPIIMYQGIQKNTQQNFTETPCIYTKTQYNEVTKREYRDSSHFSIEKPTFFATIYPKPVNLFNYYREE